MSEDHSYTLLVAILPRVAIRKLRRRAVAEKIDVPTLIRRVLREARDRLPTVEISPAVLDPHPGRYLVILGQGLADEIGAAAKAKGATRSQVVASLILDLLGQNDERSA